MDVERVVWLAAEGLNAFVGSIRADRDTLDPAKYHERLLILRCFCESLSHRLRCDDLDATEREILLHAAMLCCDATAAVCSDPALWHPGVSPDVLADVILSRGRAFLRGWLAQQRGGGHV